ncbi:Long chronological lifespan protein 2 [Salinomyces thailandicus]|uniref:Long chronological lifespan protein 2 n=1 Tax=Salinomyces thailandicus TaxID=706561 RepID=A0A4U0TS70_9PEZI|nr:Long chronological lifespan protein 2 [Salinomyces thailandica]
MQPSILPAALCALLLLLINPAAAQFQFFEQMFNPGGGAPHAPQNAASDSSWFQAQYENALCDKYLCPHTLSCVHFPHHCPCAFPAVEDKVELGDGSMICVSKDGWKREGAAGKVELARKGLL